jgi:phage/plasmid-like protein (TIGR03299 family)
MAHNLNINENGKASFVAVGEKAWHGLGSYVNEALTAEQAIVMGGMDYQVKKKNITVAGGKTIPGYFATERQDTKDVLGIVSKDYHIVQNREAFTFFDSIIDKGEAIYQTAGVLGKGERIFVTAKLPSDILVQGEVVENYLLLTSGHDGKSAIQVGFTPVRVVCNNTLTAALNGLQNKVTILHFSNAKEKLETASKIMGMSSIYTSQLNNEFNKMAQVNISDKALRLFIEEVMKPSKETINAETLQNEYSKIFTKTVDGIIDFAHNHPTQTTEAANGTVWGAYNAVSGYFGHIKNYKSQEEKMNDLYFKAGSKRIEKAFSLAISMI